MVKSSLSFIPIQNTRGFSMSFRLRIKYFALGRSVYKNVHTKVLWPHVAVGHHIFQNGKTFQIALFQSMLVVYLPIQVLIPKFSLLMKYHKNEAESLLFSISPTVTKTAQSNANEIVMFAMLNTESTTSQFTEHWKNFPQQPETRILILLHFR